jgi:hypothetical protein
MENDEPALNESISATFLRYKCLAIATYAFRYSLVVLVLPFYIYIYICMYLLLSLGHADFDAPVAEIKIGRFDLASRYLLE